MNPVNRLFRYVSAYVGLGRLNRVTASLADQPSAMIAETFRFSEGFLQPIQVEEELTRLVGDVQRLGPKTVVEIGTSMGGTLFLWTRLADPDGTIVSVDLPGGDSGGGYSSLRTPIYKRFARARQTLHLLRANSHDQSTLETLRSLLGDRPIDFLFLDGDHSYEGVRRDWEMYAPLVRPGGLVAFHDVAGTFEPGIYGAIQVKRFWDELKTGYEYREYMVHPLGQYGIGVLFK